MKYILNIFVILSLGIFCCCGGEKLTYEVVYNTNGGIWNKNFVPKTVSKTSKKISLPSNKEINRNGYIFCGWYSTELFESGTEIKDSISYKNTKRINLYAKWDLINYTINYNLNGGENSKANPVNYNVESESIILADGKRFGYDFCGWYKDKDFKEDSRIVKIIKGSAENVELFAKWGKIGEEDVSQNGKVKVTLNWNPNVKVNNVNCFLYNFETKMVEKTHKNKKISLKKDKVIYSEEEIPLGVYAVKIELYNIDNVLLNTFADIVYIEKNKISLKEEMLINLNEIYAINYNTNGGSWKKGFIPEIKRNVNTSVLLPTERDIGKSGGVFRGWYTTERFDTETKIAYISLGLAKNIELYAKWDLINYTINYNLNGGENSKANPVNYNVTDKSIVLKEAIRDGYTFAGWYRSADFSGDKVREIVQGNTGNIDLYAKWDLINYTINYNLNGGENSKANPVNYNVTDKSIVLKEAIRDGYTFAGWYRSADFSGDKVREIVQGNTGNVELYAKWNLINYTINYNLNEGLNNEANLVNYNVTDKSIVLKEAIRDGYTFAGWYRSADFSGDKVREIVQGNTGNIELYAKWDLINYAINYNLNGGKNSKVNPVNYNVTDKSIVLKEAERVGYTFAGWYRSADFSGDKVREIVQGNTGNIDLYAKWDLINYTINYNLNGGENSKVNPVNYNVTDKSIVLKEAIRDGYTFTGWYRSADFSGDKVREIVQGNTGNIDLYAKWDLINYTINYNLNGGLNNEVNPVRYNVTDKSIVLKEAERVGYTFAGWYRSADFSGDKVTEIAQGNTSNIELYAKWDLINYAINYNLNGGLNNEANPVNYNVADNSIVLKEAIRDGYTFAGWYRSADFSEDKVTEIAQGNTGNIGLYAKWDLINYTINYNLNGGLNNEANPVNYNVADNSIVLKEAIRDGYTFAGWYRSADFSGDKVTEIVQGNTGNVELYAKWNLINYTINYNLNGGLNNEVNPVRYNVTDKSIVLKEAERVGYTFAGWYRSADFSGDKVREIVQGNTGNIDLYAKWNANIYIVTLDDNESLKIAATYESVLPNIAVPHKKKGYDFKGYYFTDSNGKEYQYYNEKCVGVANWNIVGDGKLYAKWQLANYTINYNLNGGENVETNLKNYNIATESIVLKNAKRTGCTFAGWYRNADFSGDKVTEIAQGNTGNIDLYAKWDLINYTINYNLNGGKNVSVNPISYNVENKCIKLKNPRRSGALFLGWYKTADFSDNKIKFINNEISDIELYAKWYLINYKLIIIIICVLIVIVSVCVLSHKLLVDSKINKFVKKVIDNNYKLERLNEALNWKPSGKNEEIDDKNKITADNIINNYSENEIAVYKKYKNKILSRFNECKSKEEKNEKEREKNKKNEKDIKEEISEAIGEITNQITLIGQSVEKDKDPDIEMGLKTISNSLGILIKNKKHIEQHEKETNIKNLNEQFNHLCNKYKDMQGSQDNLNGVKMNQIRKKFKKILK